MNRIILGVLLAIGLIQAATLPYQGLATDAKGNPRADGAATAVFFLYTVSSGGSATWSESQAIATKKGLFSVSLGSGTAIPDSLFDGRALWLGVALDGAAEASPRLQLGSVPYANGAGRAATAQRAVLADSAGKADTARASRYADTAKVALHVVGADSASLKTARDSIQTLTTTISTLSSSLSVLYLSLSSTSSIPWNSSISYGTLTDPRDGQIYRTVKIGTQRWMAQNLNYRNTTGNGDTVGACYGNSTDSCAKYGRLYTWAEAMGTSSAYNGTLLGATLPRQGLCPSGWHVPSDAELHVLVQYVDSATSGTKLKSTSGWYSSGNGTDAYGFRALPAGLRSDEGTSGDVGLYAYFWSSSEIAAPYAWHRGIVYRNAFVYRDINDKTYGFSLRCSQN